MKGLSSMTVLSLNQTIWCKLKTERHKCLREMKKNHEITERMVLIYSKTHTDAALGAANNML